MKINKVLVIFKIGDKILGYGRGKRIERTQSDFKNPLVNTNHINTLYKLNSYKWTQRNCPTYHIFTRYCSLTLVIWLMYICGFSWIVIGYLLSLVIILCSQFKIFKNFFIWGLVREVAREKSGGKEKNPLACSVCYLHQTGTAGLTWGDGTDSVQRQWIKMCQSLWGWEVIGTAVLFLIKYPRSSNHLRQCHSQ